MLQNLRGLSIISRRCAKTLLAKLVEARVKLLRQTFPENILKFPQIAEEGAKMFHVQCQQHLDCSGTNILAMCSC